EFRRVLFRSRPGSRPWSSRCTSTPATWSSRTPPGYATRSAGSRKRRWRGDVLLPPLRGGRPGWGRARSARWLARRPEAAPLPTSPRCAGGGARAPLDAPEKDGKGRRLRLKFASRRYGGASVPRDGGQTRPDVVRCPWAVSSAVEHYLDMVGVTGSNPVPPTTRCVDHSLPIAGPDAVPGVGVRGMDIRAAS